MLICANATLAAADDPGTAPCEAMAAYLSGYAKAHPQHTEDTGWFEFLNRAAHITDDGTDEGAPVSALATKSFDTLNEALQAIPGIEVDANARQFLADAGLEGSRWLTDVSDMRPYSNHVIVSQVQGTLHCSKPAIFRVENALLVPSSAADDDPTGFCYNSGITAVRVLNEAFPAIWDGGGGDPDYSIHLLRPDERSLDRDRALCSIHVFYDAKSTIAEWKAHDSPGNWPSTSRLRSVLEPILTGNDPSAELKAIEPTSTGDSPYSALVRAADRTSVDLLRAIDPEGRLINLRDPFASPAGIGIYPVTIDDAPLLVVLGTRTGGYKMIDDSEFSVWAWDGHGLMKLATGRLGMRGTDPEITIERP